MDTIAQLKQMRETIASALQQQGEQIQRNALEAVDAAIANADQLLHDASASALLSDPRLIHAEIITLDDEFRERLSKNPCYDITLDNHYEISNLRRTGVIGTPLLSERPQKVIILFYNS